MSPFANEQKTGEKTIFHTIVTAPRYITEQS